jgi:DMSO/TMAO reductase YedYZ molybdopterin-dependent catalytic subunit
MQHQISRRSVLKGGGAAVAGFTVMRLAGPAAAFPGGGTDEIVLPWLDQPEPNPVPDAVGQQLLWEDLADRIIPNGEFFTVKHYNQPEIDPTTWVLGIDGLVEQSQQLSLDDLKAQPREEVEFTLECSGNTGLPFFNGGIGNAVWAGAALAPILEQAGPLPSAVEVVFWGADAGEVEVVGGWSAGPGTAMTLTEQFARSMSLDNAIAADNLLCYGMNGAPLPAEHGAPVRLIAPGWYGVANVKWLTRIELTDHRFAGRFMAREYVTIREEERDGNVVWTFATVGPVRLKSAPARVTRSGEQYAIAGAAWGAPIKRVEVSIDGQEWMPTQLASAEGASGATGFTWALWTVDWSAPEPGEHSITSRAFDLDGNMQPALDDAFLAAKRTYWESNGQITRRVLID